MAIHRRFAVRVFISALAVAAGLALPTTARAANDPNSQLPLSPGCQFVNTTVPSSVLNHQVAPIPVASIASPQRLTIHGRLCLPPNAPAPKTVLFALHGITYTNQYWDAGYQPGTYSFARSMMRAGYAVFAIDRLGYGKSSHPNGLLVTLDAQAAVAHAIIGQLRAGTIGGHAFPYVALVGHSYGTATSWLESAEYNDADAVIGTGWASSIQNDPLIRFFSGFATHPANLDPKTAPEVPLDPAYFTPPASARDENYLYDLSNVDPKMIQYDANTLRDTVTAGEGSTFINRYSRVSLGYFPFSSSELSAPLTPVTPQIRIPMFLVNGEHDLFFCGPDTMSCNSSQALQKEEAPYFSPAACERAAVTPNAGHDLNLQRNAPYTYGIIRTWANQVLGQDGSKLAGYKASCERFSGSHLTGGAADFGALPAS